MMREFARGIPGESRTPACASAGVTLLETLLACTLLTVLLVAAMAVNVEAGKTLRLNEDVAARSQIVELASELLRYHLGLAGHEGLGVAGDDGLAGPALTLARGVSPGGSDAVNVRYLEERWYRQPELRALHFDVKRDSNGRWNLYQREEGATRQPAVKSVTGMRVTGFVAADGALLPPEAPLPLEAAAIELELRFAWDETRLLTVGLPGVQRVSAAGE